MARSALLVAAVAVLCAVSAQSARVPGDLIASMHYEGFPHGLASTVSSLKAALLQSVIRKGGEQHEEKFEETHISTIRFTVPPSIADDFEDEWMKLEKEVRREKNNDMYDLKKTKLDNLFYLAYGEWDSHSDLMDHLSSDHFSKFAEFVDREDIRWDVQILKDLSYGVEEKQRDMQKYRDVTRGKDEMAHVLFMYTVPPGEDEGFVNQWTDTAYKTIEEDGNRIYSLRRVATDNTRFYGYGTWDSMRDYLDHFTSSHVADLTAYAEEKDIVWFVVPLEKIGHEDE